MDDIILISQANSLSLTNELTNDSIKLLKIAILSIYHTLIADIELEHDLANTQQMHYLYYKEALSNDVIHILPKYCIFLNVRILLPLASQDVDVFIVYLTAK